MASQSNSDLPPDFTFQMRAMQQQFERFQNMFGDLRDRMERQDNILDEIRRDRRQNQRGGRENEGEKEDEQSEMGNGVREKGNENRGIYNGGGRWKNDDKRIGTNRARYESYEKEENSLSGIKVYLPPFQGKFEPEPYLEWEMSVDMVFNCYNLKEEEKLRLAVRSFSPLAITWWDVHNESRKKKGEKSIKSWGELKEAMKLDFGVKYLERLKRRERREKNMSEVGVSKALGKESKVETVEPQREREVVEEQPKKNEVECEANGMGNCKQEVYPTLDKKSDKCELQRKQMESEIKNQENPQKDSDYEGKETDFLKVLEKRDEKNMNEFTKERECDSIFILKPPMNSFSHEKVNLSSNKPTHFLSSVFPFVQDFRALSKMEEIRLPFESNNKTISFFSYSPSPCSQFFFKEDKVFLHACYSLVNCLLTLGFTCSTWGSLDSKIYVHKSIVSETSLDLTNSSYTVVTENDHVVSLLEAHTLCVLVDNNSLELNDSTCGFYSKNDYMKNMCVLDSLKDYSCDELSYLLVLLDRFLSLRDEGSLNLLHIFERSFNFHLPFKDPFLEVTF